MRIKSPAAYKHLREAKILPLPHKDTLAALIAAQKCGFGFNQTSMEAIRKAFIGKPRRDKQGVLIFDEIQLRETMEFNTQGHRFDGFIDYGEYTGEILKTSDKTKLANHALVLMFRPLNDNWVKWSESLSCHGHKAFIFRYVCKFFM